MAETLGPDDPERIGRYRIVRRLGQGGMGTVYLGEGPEGERAAVKVINAELAGTPQFRERFRREVEAARRVRRFCTAPVLDAGLDEPPWYIVTEYISGPSLDEAVADGPLRGGDLEGLGIGVATALAAIHDAGLVHRDLKPSNVLLSPVGPRVIDFGIARALDAQHGMTQTGQIIGTPAYLAPELVTGGAISPAADVFSWGCVMAFAGTGRSPFHGSTLPEILHRVAYDAPRLDGLDAQLRGIVEATLAKDPALRPTVADLLEHLTGRRATGVDRLERLPVPTEASTPQPAPTQPAAHAFPPFAPSPGSHPTVVEAPHHGAGPATAPRRPPIALFAGIAAFTVMAAVAAFLITRDEEDKTPKVTPTPISWAESASDFDTVAGTRFTLGCTADGAKGPVWGTDTYTLDSSICTAAVHAGLITTEKGGTVTINIIAGAPAYVGSFRYGVSSGSWGGYPKSYTFIRK